MYRTNLAPVWRYVRARVPDHEHAQDVTADVFARAWRNWPSFDPVKGTVGAWLGRIAHHAVVDWLRRRRDLPTGTIPDAPGGVDPQDEAVRGELITNLRRRVAELPERERDALALRFGAGLKAVEVGEVLGMTEGAVKMLVHRAVVKLRTVMADD